MSMDKHSQIHENRYFFALSIYGIFLSSCVTYSANFEYHIERWEKEPIVSGAAMKRWQVCQEAIKTVSDGLNKLSRPTHETSDLFQQACSYSYTHRTSSANLGVETKVACRIRPFPIMIYKVH